MQINHFNKTYLKYFSFIIFFICIFIVSLEVYNNIIFITDLIALNFKYVYILLVLQFFFLFLYNYRFFFSYNFFLKKKIKFSHWTYYFFKSLIYNNLLNFLGTVYRALFLKKRGISYVKSTSILYLLYFSDFTIRVGITEKPTRKDISRYVQAWADPSVASSAAEKVAEIMGSEYAYPEITQFKNKNGDVGYRVNIPKRLSGKELAELKKSTTSEGKTLL